MFQKKCKCGKSNKNFKFDIGPYFTGECCIRTEFEKEAPAPQKPKADPDAKYSKNQLKNLMNLEQLKEIAKARGVEDYDKKTKRVLIDILKD